MGILQTLFGAERRTFNSADDFWYSPILAWTPTASGVKVDSMSAMRCAAVAACVRVLSESVASLPLHLYQRLEDGGKVRATGHWLYELLHDTPNAQMTAYQWLELAMVHLTLTGNHYSELTLDRSGRPVEMNPLWPGRVDIRARKGGGVEYAYREDIGQERIIPLEKMLHIPGMGFDGISGMSQIAYSRESIGMALAGEEFGARFYGTGMNPGHIMTLPDGQRFDDEQTQKFLDDLKEKYSGLGKSHKSLVLPSGMTISQVGIPPEDAQYIESRRFQVEEIARIFRVPLHMVGETTKNTSWGTGIESMTLGFVTYTLRPWLTRIEQALERKLLPAKQKSTYFVEFLIADLLRGDQVARSQYYMLAVQNGWMSRNEVRIIENMNPVEGGDEFLVPLNMTIAGEPVPGPLPDPEEEPRHNCADHVERHAPVAVANESWFALDKRAMARSRQSIQKSYARVIGDVYERMLVRERKDVLRAVEAMTGKRAETEIGQWLTNYYNQHAVTTTRNLNPAMTALAEAIGAASASEIGREFEWVEELSEWLGEYVTTAGTRYTGLQVSELLRLLDTTLAEGGDVVTAFNARFSEWEDIDGAARAATRAGYETTRLGNGFARETWRSNGTELLTWVATGDKTCPMCDHLDGRTIVISKDFMGPGDSIGDFSPGSTVAHPPLHAGCDCIIVPGS